MTNPTPETQSELPATPFEPVWKKVALNVVEVGLLVLLFFCFAAAVPGVNEPHYLCKAKHFWDSSFCPNDIFLESSDAHYLFYFTLGLLTKFLTLPSAALIGRIICWTAIAIGWQFFSRSLFDRRFWSLPAAGLFLLGLEYCHFAGEWLIGGVEAKAIAYAFVFAGMGFMVQKKWVPVWLMFGLGSAFHVLVGGWAVVAGFLVWIGCRGWRKGLSAQLVSGGLGLLVSMFGLIPALVLTVGQDPNIVQSANEIYTFERIAHHLVFSHIVDSSPERLDLFLFAMMFWIGLQWVCWEDKRFRIVGLFVAATLLIASGAILIENYAISSGRPHIAASLLRFYWFRLADVFVPIGVALGVSLVTKKCMTIRYEFGAVILAVVAVAVLLVISLRQLEVAIKQRSQADALTLPAFPTSSNSLLDELPINRKIARDWVDVCTWIRARTPTESRFLTPRSQSTFKWYSHRSEVVAWKDVPQDAVGIVNWRNCFGDVFGSATFRFGLASLNAEKELLRLGHDYKAEYVVIERRHVRERKKELEFRYRYQNYLLGKKEVSSTPFVKPLCLKQVYPDSSCSKEIQNESSYLVYQLVIPDAYRPQMKELDSMLRWYEQLDAYYQSQSQSQGADQN